MKKLIFFFWSISNISTFMMISALWFGIWQYSLNNTWESNSIMMIIINDDFSILFLLLLLLLNEIMSIKFSIPSQNTNMFWYSSKESYWLLLKKIWWWWWWWTLSLKDSQNMHWLFLWKCLDENNLILRL